MGYQMAQTPVTLNDPEGHFRYQTHFNLLFGKYDTCIKFDICVLALDSKHVACDLE